MQQIEKKKESDFIVEPRVYKSLTIDLLKTKKRELKESLENRD